jgi:tetratricopeptide (TPR) repeat protein
MAMRHGWLLLGLLGLGCHGVLPAEPDAEQPQAKELWQQGQTALRQGRTDESIALYQQSLAADPSLTRNHLSLAAAYLEKGQDALACTHLAEYVKAHPEHVSMRVHLAELLLRLHRADEARAEFERTIADAQDQPEERGRHLFHCHSRLVDIAEETGDEYGEYLNRGIALYVLARERATLPDPDGELSTQALLCKAAGQLGLAGQQRPEEARPCWYLYEVWSQLAQREMALRWLREADDAAPFSYLTPAEQRSLELAWQHYHDPSAKR